MSELIKTRRNVHAIRWQLLSTVSALALVTVGVAARAEAEDADHPTVWIELGGQLERMSDKQETFAPGFLSKFENLNFQPVLPLQRPLQYANGAEGKISFEPSGAPWVFSAAIRYGRSNGKMANYQRVPAQIYYLGARLPTLVKVQTPPDHLDASTKDQESHAVLDFKIGKDVGLGLFSGRDASVFSLGVRFAQFASKRAVDLTGVPDRHHVGSLYKYGGVFRSNHRYYGTADTNSSFRGVGPSLSWDASAQILGKGDGEEITFDWGINAAALFGRQKIKGDSSVTGLHYRTYKELNLPIVSYHGLASSYRHPMNIDRSRSVVIPNLGGFVGASLKFPNAKVSLGYRADFFFGAMDGGIDTRKTYDRNFYGPFATISIGLGG